MEKYIKISARKKNGEAQLIHLELLGGRRDSKPLNKKMGLKSSRAVHFVLRFLLSIKLKVQNSYFQWLLRISIQNQRLEQVLNQLFGSKSFESPSLPSHFRFQIESFNKIIKSVSFNIFYLTKIINTI
jgi:hypothetical protein